jgi:hypothetical protein
VPTINPTPRYFHERLLPTQVYTKLVGLVPQVMKVEFPLSESYGGYNFRALLESDGSMMPIPSATINHSNLTRATYQEMVEVLSDFSRDVLQKFKQQFNVDLFQSTSFIKTSHNFSATSVRPDQNYHGVRYHIDGTEKGKPLNSYSAAITPIHCLKSNALYQMPDRLTLAPYCPHIAKTKSDVSAPINANLPSVAEAVEVPYEEGKTLGWVETLNRRPGWWGRLLPRYETTTMHGVGTLPVPSGGWQAPPLRYYNEDGILITDPSHVVRSLLVSFLYPFTLKP